MPSEEVVLRLSSKGPLTEFTRENPHVRLALWCDWTNEVLEVAGATEDERADVERIVSRATKRVEWHDLDAATRIAVMDCVDLPHDLVNVAVDHARCVNLPPTRFDAGAETHTLLSFSERQTREVVHAIQESGREVTIVAKRPLRAQPLLNTRGVGLGALLGGLTEKQIEALLLAQRHGLYANPRRTTAESVAKARGLARSTFGEHLRKGEAHLLASLVPCLELELKARRAPAAAIPS